MIKSLASQLQSKPPLATVLGALVLMMGGILLLQMLAQQDLYFIYKTVLGGDYRIVYRATEIVLAGGDPYNPPLRYVYPAPPVPAIANIPLTYFSPPVASALVALLIYAAVVASLFVVHRAFTPPPACATSPR